MMPPIPSQSQTQQGRSSSLHGPDSETTVTCNKTLLAACAGVFAMATSLKVSVLCCCSQPVRYRRTLASQSLLTLGALCQLQRTAEPQNVQEPHATIRAGADFGNLYF